MEATYRWNSLYAFKEADKTGAACFVQLVHTGIGQHLCEHMAYLVLQDQVHIVGVQLRVLCKDFLGPLGMLLQGLGVLCGGRCATSTSARSNSSCFRRLGSTAKPITSMRPMFSFLMWCSLAWGWYTPSGCSGVVMLLRSTRSS